MVTDKGSLIQLSPEHEQASTQEQSANVWDWFLKFDVPEGVEWVIQNGVYVIGKLYEDGGSEISGQTKLAFAYKAPGDPTFEIISPEMTYRPFSNLTPSEQRDSDYKSENMQIFFPRDEVSFEEDTPIYIVANGPDSIDLAESDSYFDFNVQEYEL